MRAAVIYHEGRVRRERLEPIIAEREALNGWEPTLWLPMTKGVPSSAQVDAAADAAVDLVIAAGGDGTVRGVAVAAAGRNLQFAAIPVGTANLFARNLGLPLTDPVEAVRIAFGGALRRVDIGVLEYRLEDGTEGSLHYLVMAGFGIDADMVAGTDKRLKRKFGWVAYVGPIVWAMRPRRGVPLDISMDGSLPSKRRLHSVFLGNCGIITAGIRLLPDASMDDGLLDVLAIRNVATWVQRRALPGYAVDAPGGTVRGAFSYTTARRVELRLDRPVQFQADGDPIGLVVWARATVEREALLIRVP
jgi:diacylglycerol kinase (ATP)